ncbi:uncharacterized protein MEPE_04215 [Melanopsichium pennsylvanicum]|uniref:N-acetyltransferase domain-containing protein n=2 Tax=Melanopsichium pennsylvanicum TaxID=63383 RepID=A0AAJ4XPE4_9BASI|nr:conserved hypothetical protein [Melanopsichium pennsylvanicum 4]SNX85506.1 uncharacterized protein MEPE_04215 [Melanopsichium pennsylvanicum]
MPRRKIGADLKEALCKLYEAGDISADTIEKHGIMSRATFFRNLKMYKTGASLEQRHSTGRKTNADKLKEQEKQELDSLQPAHLSHLELVLLLDDDERSAPGLALRTKRKVKTAASGSSKRREFAKETSGDSQGIDSALGGEDSGSESEGNFDEGAALANRQALGKLTQAARSFLTSSDSGTLCERSGPSSNSGELDSSFKAEDSHYSHSNRGALYIVRQRSRNANGDASGELIAAVALRSLIWTPQIYQALGPSYASRSIDKICNLTRLRVDPKWQRKGIGRWLVNAAELKASKLGFSHLYSQSDARHTELLSFWRKTGFHQFARLKNVEALEKLVVAPTTRMKNKASSIKRAARSPPSTSAADGDKVVPETSGSKKRRIGSADANEGVTSQTDSSALASAIDPVIPLDPSIPVSGSSALSTLSRASTLSDSLGMLPQSSTAPLAPSAAILLTNTTASAALPGSGSAAAPIWSAPTPNDSTHMATGPPPRRIAFHEADSAGS